MQLKSAAAVALVLLVGGFSYFYMTGGMATAPSAEQENGAFDTQVPATPDIETAYACDGGKSLSAGFSDRLVTLALSDGRSFTLEQKVSASGARYANEGDAVVFWDKGGFAFLEENGAVTFENCAAGGRQEEDLPEPEMPVAAEPMMAEGTPESQLAEDMLDEPAQDPQELQLQ